MPFWLARVIQGRSAQVVGRGGTVGGDGIGGGVVVEGVVGVGGTGVGGTGVGVTGEVTSDGTAGGTPEAVVPVGDPEVAIEPGPPV